MDDTAGKVWVDVAVSNSLPQVTLEHTSQLLFIHDFIVDRAYLDVVSDGENGNITFLRLLVTPNEGAKPDKSVYTDLKRQLKRIKWLDPLTMNLVFERYPHMGVRRGEIITAMCSLMHPIMAKQNAMAFSKGNIYDTVTKERYIGLAMSIADLFLARFDPKDPLSNVELAAESEKLKQTVENDVEDTVAMEIFNKMIDIVRHTLRTNIYLNDRYSLGLRLDPRIMVMPGAEEKETPYGVFFVHGRRFNGYHVRFRDISRGGMRLVTPQSPEQHALESAHQYDECYGLAFAQQLKNKDIPEGGSKAVNLINVTGLSSAGRDFVVRKSVKAFTDTILDLIVDTAETRENVVDFWGKKEVLYLGPDEQVSGGRLRILHYQHVYC